MMVMVVVVIVVAAVAVRTRFSPLLLPGLPRTPKLDSKKARFTKFITNRNIQIVHGRKRLTPFVFL
jgi:hypothetical protein